MNKSTPPDFTISKPIDQNSNYSWKQISLSFSEAAVNSFIRQLNKPIFLDGSYIEGGANYQIISGSPIKTLRDESLGTINNDLKVKISALEHVARQMPQAPSTIEDLPFTAGLAGFVSYEYGSHQNIDSFHALNKNKQEIEQDNLLPTIYIGLFTWSLVKNLNSKTAYLTFSPLCSPKEREQIQRYLLNSNQEHETLDKEGCFTIDWHKTLTKQSYQQQVATIKDYILAGDCYQVNFTQRFEARANVDTLDYYQHLASKTKTPYSCYLSFGDNRHLLSFSPEQFIGIKDKLVSTKPIKGTIANTGTESGKSLQASEKNQAENLMIVDLLRNDLSKVCELYSVKVDKLFSLETYPNVHHLVSHISGKLKPEISELDAFFACFPGGSITGAPKKRAMEIIEELEASVRNAYCGSVFYLNHDGQFDSNILIRSIVKSGDKLHCWGGGGIIADSDIEEEYIESLTKVANLTGITS